MGKGAAVKAYWVKLMTALWTLERPRAVAH
jgi:hypothetical protein